MAGFECTTLVGYARVSTRLQDHQLQLDALERAGVDRVFHEKGSSVGARPQLQRALASLRPGQVLVVYKLDRLARSLKDLLQVLERLERLGCGLRSLTEPIDTSSVVGQLILQILGAVAQFERSLIRERSLAGQVAAMRRGVKFGREPALTFEQCECAAMMVWSGCRSADVAAFFGVSRASIWRAEQVVRGISDGRVRLVWQAASLGGS